MYTYKLYVFVIYLLSLRWTAHSTSPEAATQKTNVTFDLSKLNEHGSLTEVVDSFKLKVATFTTPDDKVVDKVVYDGADVWVSSTDGNKVLKKLVVTNRSNIPQLLHLVLTSAAGATTQEENAYYKKEKTQFTKFNEVDYNKEKGKFDKSRTYYLNKWYPLNFARTELYSANTKEQRDLEDGVWKYTYTFLNGTVNSVKDGTDSLWTHSENNNLSSVQKLDFGDGNLLLSISAGSVKKYFYKTSSTSTWQGLDAESNFLTKATEFKSNYFAEKLEYDLSTPPNRTHFYIKRSQYQGNHNELTLFVYRGSYLGLVKYKGTSLWPAEKDTRVLYLKMDLLYHEVKTVMVVYAQSSTSPFPTKKSAYFYKDADGTFKKVTDRSEFTKHVDKVKAAVDTSTKFVYNDLWPSLPKPLDLSNFNPEDLTVVKSNLNNGVTQETLTPKAVAPLNGLTFRGVALWPTAQQSATDPKVTEVVVVSKNTLPQFVHLKATKAGTGSNAARVEVNLFFKKVGETFTSVQDSAAFETLKSGLVAGTQTHDTHVHLDFNLETLNSELYEVTTEYVDGVNKKVVTPKNIKVTKLFSYRTDLWVRPSTSSNYVLKKYELYTYGNKSLLKLHVGTPEDATALTEEYHEKTDANVAWTKFTTNFNDKLLAFKSVETWTPLELDVSVSPPATDYNLEVKSLGGNKTKLTLEPLPGKKLTKVKLGTNSFFTACGDTRAYKVELHLEVYQARFVKVFVQKDVPGSSPQLTEEKHFKDLSASAPTWANTDFDAKLDEFVAATNTVPFTYNASWVVPPMTFDFKTANTDYFQSVDETEGLVKTTTHTALAGTVVNKVLLDGARVWPEGAESAGDPNKKLVTLKVLSKNDMVQLVHLTNALVATPTTTEDLYYKKATDTYEKLEPAKFNELKTSLSKADEYVDDKVKLDLSATEQASTNLFKKETTLEDGVEKTVVTVKAGKLFQVSASPPLWKSTDGSYVTKLERYVLDLTQLLVLHITKPDNSTEMKYFQKPVTPPAPAPSQPGTDSSGEARQTQQETQVPGQTEQQQQPPQQQQPQQVQQEVQPAVSTRPSFEALTDKTAFFAKLNQAKDAVAHQDVSLDVTAYQDERFNIRQKAVGTATMYTLQPKKPYRVNKFVNGRNNDLWEKEEDGQRLVEAYLYLHNSKFKFAKALVWPKDRTDESKDKLLHFKLQNQRLEKVEADVFTRELTELTGVQQTPPSPEVPVQPPPTPYSFHKFYLSDKVDADLFELTERKKGAYKLKNYTPKENKFVNVVETQHGVLWKAEDGEDYMKSSFFAVTDNSALAHLTVLENSTTSHLFFKFENDKWARLDGNTYVDLYTQAGLTSASK